MARSLGRHQVFQARHAGERLGQCCHCQGQSAPCLLLQVTGLSEKLVREIAESMQVLRYPANGGHYSCHHDSVARWDRELNACCKDPEQEDPRFMTLFFFLNDVEEGGETVLFGTDMDGSFPGRSESAEAWQALSG